MTNPTRRSRQPGARCSVYQCTVGQLCSSARPVTGRYHLLQHTRTTVLRALHTQDVLLAILACFPDKQKAVPLRAVCRTWRDLFNSSVNTITIHSNLQWGGGVGVAGGTEAENGKGAKQQGVADTELTLLLLLTSCLVFLLCRFACQAWQLSPTVMISKPILQCCQLMTNYQHPAILPPRACAHG